MPRGKRKNWDGIYRNDSEREQWVINDESLYRWWKSSRLSKRNFIRANRKKLDEYIAKKVG